MFRFPCVARPGALRPVRQKPFGASFPLAFLPLLALLLFPASLAAQQRTLSGTVTLEGPTAASTPPGSSVPLTFDFCANDKPLFFSRTITPASNGAFTVTDLPPGKYILAIKGSKWLRSIALPAISLPLPADPHTIDLTTADKTGVTATLLAADATDDDIVDLGDFGVLASAYNSYRGDSSYDARADFTNDGAVDVGDFGLLANNYNTYGATYAANLRAVGTVGGVTLTWVGTPVGSADTDHYNIYRNGVLFNTATTTTYTDNSGAGVFSYYVTSVSFSGLESPASNVASGTPQPVSLASVDTAQPGWAEDIIPTDSPATAGAGPSSATSIDVSSGILENHPGPDLDAYNSVGLSPIFARLYRSAQAERSVSSPGLPRGWTHNYDMTLTAASPNALSNLTLTYPNGAKETWVYSNGNLTPQTNGTPYVVLGVANGAGQWTSLTMKFKDRTSYVFELRDSSKYRLTKMVNVVGHAITIAYDGTGKLTGIVNDDTPSQPLLQFAYSGVLLSGVTDAVSNPVRTVNYTYAATGGINENVTQIRTPFKNQKLATTFTYETDPINYPFGRLKSVTEGNLTLGKFRTPTTYTYYDYALGTVGKGLLKRIDGPQPGTSNAQGNPTGPTSLVVEYTYTALGNVLSVHKPAPNDTAPFVAYDMTYAAKEALGQPATVSPPPTYTQSGLAKRAVKSYTYDARGNVTHEQDALGYYTDYDYDYANHVTKVIFPPDVIANPPARAFALIDYLGISDETVRTRLYKEYTSSNPLDFNAQNGVLFQQTLKNMGNEGEFKTLGGDALSSGHDYDALYRARNTRDGRNSQTGFEYDKVGRLTKIAFPGNAGGTSDSQTATFDPEGNVQTQTDGLGNTTTTDRDPADSRVMTVHYPASANRSDITLTYDDYGRAIASEDAVSIQRVFYDDDDFATRTETVYKDIPTMPTLRTDYTYFPDGSRKTMMVAPGPTGSYVYSYHDNGLLKQVIPPWNAPVEDFYRTNGWLNIEQTPQTIATYTTNGRQRTTQVFNKVRSNSSTLSSFVMQYDTPGNLKKTTLDIPRTGQAPPIVGGGGSFFTFGYDSVSRLKSEVSILNDDFTTQKYTPGYDLFHAYDAANNLTQLRSSLLDLPYNANDQLSTQTNNGNGDTTSYGDFDGSSRLKTAKAASGPVFTAGYLADGRRAWKQTTADGKRFYYLYDGDTVIAELDAAGNWTNGFVYGAAGLSQRQGRINGVITTYYYTYDPQGNVVQRISQPNPNPAEFTAFYDAFGTQRSQVSAQSGEQFPTPDMVGYRGQFGAWTDNDTDPAMPVVGQVRSPSIWTGERYYDPFYARHLTRETYAATENLAWATNAYIADPNPLGHTVGNVLAGVAGGLVGGPFGSAAAVGAWEGLYSYALGEPLDAALTQGVVAGVTDFAGGKAFHFAAGAIGAGAKSVSAKFVTRISESSVAKRFITGARASEIIESYGQAERTYSNIRTLTTDVAAISRATGLRESWVQRVKDHVFYNTHILDSSVRRFDADPAIAAAWMRLQTGIHTPQDLMLIVHELFEARFEGIFKTNYRTAHEAANRAGKPSGL